MTRLGDDHRALLHRALALPNLPERLDQTFRGMLANVEGPRARYETLSAAQAAWVRRTVASLDGPESTRLTSGDVPAGRPVATPAVLAKPLPMKPSGVRA